MVQQTYQPISCDYYDVLEALAVQRKRTVVEYRNEAGAKITLENALIVDLITKDKVEYMKLDRGLILRLDQLLSVNGTTFDGASCGF